MTSHSEASRHTSSFLLKKKSLLLIGLVVLILFAGFIGSVYLVQQQTATNSKAEWVGDGDDNLVWHWKCTKTTYRNQTCDSEQRDVVDNFDVYTHENFNPENWNCEDDGSHRDYTGCTFIGNACIGGTNPGDLNTCITSLTTTPRPPIDPGNSCGDQCDENNPCTSGYSCTQDRVCWNDNACGDGQEPPMARIEGRVFNCANQPVAGVAAKAWGVTKSTDATGRFRISKKVKNLNDIVFMQTSVKVGIDVITKPSEDPNHINNNKYYTSRGLYTPEPYAALRLPEYASGQNQSCGKLNCTYFGRVGDGSTLNEDYKLLAGGPERYAYMMYSMEDDFFARNFVSQTRYTGSFDFKEANCPQATATNAPPTNTPTPASVSCNMPCTSDAQCTAGTGNEGRYCMTNYVTYWWTKLVDDFNDNDGLPAGAKITGMNNRLSPDGQKYQQHVVAGNKIYYRERPRSATSWTNIPLSKMLNNVDINTYIDDVGCGALGKTTTETCNAFKNEYKLVDFNSYHYTRNGNKYTQQHLIRSNGSKAYIFAANNEEGWKSESAWTDETARGFGGDETPSPYDTKFTINSDGSLNGLTSFSAYMDKDGRLDLHAVIGGKVYSRRPGLYNEWRELTKSPSIFASCEASGSCGTNVNNATPIRMFKSMNTGDNRYYSYLVRSDGVNVYQRTAAAPVVNGVTQEVCRLRWMPHNQSCSPQL